MATSKTVKNPTVSQYFQKNSETNTPNKIDIKDKFNDSADDFRSPMPIPKKKNLIWKLNKPKQQTKSKNKTRRKNFTLELINDNFKGKEENPEHLQMAIALSKSTYEAEYGQSSDLEHKEQMPDIGEILQNAKPTKLEQYGFKKIKPCMGSKCRTSQKPETSKRGKARPKFITPILEIRTPQQREIMVESKITFILNQPKITSKEPSQISLTSLKLQEFKSESPKIFCLDKLYEKNNFYVEDLLLEKNSNKCGFLLKDWSLIIGRDKSPTRDSKIKEELSLEQKSVKNQINTESPWEEILQKNDVSKEKIKNQINSTNSIKIGNLQITNCAKNSPTSQILLCKELSLKESTLQSSTSLAKDSRKLSIKRTISPDLFDSDDEYVDSLLNKNENLPASPEINKKIAIVKKDKNIEIIDLIADNDDIPMDQSNSMSRQASFYSLEEFEDNNKEIAHSPSFWDEKWYEDCVLSPKHITEDKDIEKIGLIEDLPHFYKTENKRPCITFQKDNSEPLDSINPPKILYDSKKNLHEDFLNVTDEELVSSQKHLKNYISQSSPIKNLPLNSFTGPGKTSPSNLECLSKQSCIEILNDTDNNFEAESFACNTGNLIDNDNSLKTLENFENNLSLKNQTCLEKIATEMDVNSPLLEQSFDDIHEHMDQISKTLDYSPNRSNSSQHNQNCIELFDGFIYDQKPSDNSIFYENPKENFDCKVNNSKITKKYIYSNTPKENNIRTSNVINSADLNVTDYVKKVLNQENVSFKHQIQESDEEMPSQDSQNDFIDEELNYSCNYSTPVRPCETQNDLVFDDFEDIVPKPASPEALKQPIIDLISTPNKYIIKTKNITPMPDYDNMQTPLIKKELEKMGIKPLKRTRGSKLLKYIYETTHPLVGTVHLMDKSDSEEENKIIKRRKRQHCKVENLEELNFESSIEIVGDQLVQNEKSEDLIFERKQPAKISSCRIPLQIVWHNFLSCNPTIEENILLYEPLQLESLHLLLKEQGFKFHIQDLLSFLDKKCITIRTNQNRGKNNR